MLAVWIMSVLVLFGAMFITIFPNTNDTAYELFRKLSRRLKKNA